MRNLSYKTYLDKVYGCFIGKAVSGNIGAPHEGVKMPMELPFMPEMINCELPNDDLDLQILWLDVLEQKGASFTSFDLLERFVTHCAYSPGEYAVMRKNFKRGIYPPVSGKFCNDYYRNGMGCPIRSEIWAAVAVGNPVLAAEFASRDGCLDHYGESIDAERFLAALESEAFFADEKTKMADLITRSLAVVPETSPFYGLVVYVLSLCDKYKDSKTVLTKLLFRYGHPDCTNMLQNMGITLMALLLGENDIIKTSMLALNCGFDTDCTCATAGAVIGILRGADELMRAYGLTEIPYALGVKSNRRSNKIFDLAEDIAHIGVEFCKNVNTEVTLSGAPEVAFCFEKQPELGFFAEYESQDPSIALGKTRKVELCFENRSDTVHTYAVEVGEAGGVICRMPHFSIVLAPGEKLSVPAEFFLPDDTELVYDRNIFPVTVTENGKTVLETSFGLAGATPWKLTGPFWRTEPICNTERILAHFSEKYPYSALMSESCIPGTDTDKKRHFHLNFFPDTKTDFADETALFAPLDRDYASPVVEQTLASIPEDSFRLSDFFGFRGPCTAYLSRILVVPDDVNVCIQVGHSAPFALYVNGECVGERENCDNWTAENVHLENIRLHKGENKIVLRATRVNEDAKYNVTFSLGRSCAEQIVWFASKNPYRF